MIHHHALRRDARLLAVDQIEAAFGHLICCLDADERRVEACGDFNGRQDVGALVQANAGVAELEVDGVPEHVVEDRDRPFVVGEALFPADLAVIARALAISHSM